MILEGLHKTKLKLTYRDDKQGKRLFVEIENHFTKEHEMVCLEKDQIVRLADELQNILEWL